MHGLYTESNIYSTAKNREVPGCPRECSILSGRAGSNNRRTEEVFLLRDSRTKRSSENSNGKSGSVLVYTHKAK